MNPVGGATLVVAMAVTASAVADPRPRAIAPPCNGCIVEVPPKRDGAVPLIVILHGDREHARPAAKRWSVAARKRGFAMLALECPKSEGCTKQSWWRWNGDPQWVKDRVAQLGKTVEIDPARTFVIGWSGGASYLGMHAGAWADAFAAVVFHGGGIAPRSSACGTRPLPAYFLIGDGNPLHDLRLPLNDHFVKCKDKVVWNLLRGADHEGERRALTQVRALLILDWLDENARRTP